jgi:hypothetical protein
MGRFVRYHPITVTSNPRLLLIASPVPFLPTSFCHISRPSPIPCCAPYLSPPRTTWDLCQTHVGVSHAAAPVSAKSSRLALLISTVWLTYYDLSSTKPNRRVCVVIDSVTVCLILTPEIVWILNGENFQLFVK